MDHCPGRLSKIFIIIFILHSLLSGCSSPTPDTTLPTGEYIDLYYPPVLGYLRKEIGDCISSLNSISPHLYKRSSAYTTLDSGEIVLSLGELDWGDNDYFVTQISTQKILFITNSANPIQSMKIDELKAIFSGRQSRWEKAIQEETITVMVYPESFELSAWIQKALLDTSRIAPDSILAPDPRFVLDTITKDPAAIGYLPEAWVDNIDPSMRSNLNILKIESDSEIYSPLPVLAYMKEKPDGAARDFLLCLQDK